VQSSAVEHVGWGSFSVECYVRARWRSVRRVSLFRRESWRAIGFGGRAVGAINAWTHQVRLSYTGSSAQCASNQDIAFRNTVYSIIVACEQQKRTPAKLSSSVKKLEETSCLVITGEVLPLLHLLTAYVRPNARHLRVAHNKCPRYGPSRIASISFARPLTLSSLKPSSLPRLLRKP
jgi:hypothetical protein